MTRTAALALLLVVASLAGCVQDQDPTKGLRDVFGSTAIEQKNGTTVVAVPVLEGKTPADANWGKQASIALMVPKVSLQKSDPGPQGGGGTTKDLELPSSSIQLLVRFHDAEKLSGYQAHWSVVRSATANFTWSEPQSATKEFNASATGLGPVFVAAELLKDGKVVATVSNPFVASVSVQWTVESAVRPMRAMDPAPTPPNYDEMSDKFFLNLDVGGASIVAETKYRGSYGPGSGTDVDLEVDPPDAKTKCSGTGGASNPAPVDSSQATEKVEIAGVGAGKARILVGAGDEAKCGNTFFYNNPGMVPYTLTLTLSY